MHKRLKIKRSSSKVYNSQNDIIFEAGRQPHFLFPSLYAFMGFKYITSEPPLTNEC